ncbi:MAG: flippase [Actinobacteria bacterium]|nr:flippase [Actinomycetota bacterium]MBE3114415.1 flippase [Actinomycetota bacterium]
MIARFYSLEQFGLFNLYYTFLTIFGVIAAVGLQDGLARYIGYYTGKDEKENIGAVIRWGLLFGLISAIFVAVGLYLISGYIAPFLAEDPDFSLYLKLVAITIPFLVIFNILISIFRGFQRIKENIIFSSLIQPTLILVSIIVLGLMALTFVNVLIAVSLTFMLNLVFFYVYYLRNKKYIFRGLLHGKLKLKIGKELLLFSLPLLLVGIMVEIMEFTDTITLAYLKTEAAVGLYSAAKPLSHFILTGFTISMFIYQPLVSNLFAKNRFKENEAIYLSLTKWICFITLPVALCFVLFPKAVLSIYGTKYLIAASTLQVFVVIYFLHNFLGPNHCTLIAYGKSNFVMYVNTLGAILNVIGNFILIPTYGPAGAAVATGISLLSISALKAFKMFKLSGINVFRSYIIKPIFLTSLIAVLIAIPVGRFITVNLIALGILFILFTTILLLIIILSKSFSKEDIELVLLVEKSTGLNFKRTKRLLRRFL